MNRRLRSRVLILTAVMYCGVALVALTVLSYEGFDAILFATGTVIVEQISNLLPLPFDAVVSGTCQN